MKSRSFVCLVVLAVLAPSCGGGSGGGTPRPPVLAKWQTQQRSPTSSDLRTVIFANPTQGIIAGKNGTIFRTDDGGAAWTQQEFLPPNRTGDILAMSAFGTTLAAAGKDGAFPTLGRVWEGRNSTSWVTADLDATIPYFSDVNVSDPGAGNVPGSWWALRNDNGQVYYSFNGTPGDFPSELLPGAIPTPPVHVPPTHPIDWIEANGIVFIGTTGTGLICGKEEAYGGYPADPVAPSAYPAEPAHGQQGMIIRTGNYGLTFIRANITPSAPKTFRRFAVTKANTTGVTRAYCIGDSATDNGVLYVTSLSVADQWDKVDGTNVPAGAPRFRGVSFPVNDLAGWVVGDAGTIYKISATFTINPGNPTAVPPIPPFYVYAYTWTAQNSTVADDLYSVSFADNSTGYAVGDNGVVVKTTNGGATWTKISKGGTANFNAAAFTDDGIKGIAVGDGGVVYRTLDSGTTWTSMGTPAGAVTLRGAAVPRLSTTTAFLCGANGTLMRNVDVWGLGTWNQAAAGTNVADTYEAVLFPQGADRGVCVGSTVSGRKILRTTDGDTWSTATLPANPASNSYLALSCNPAGTEVYASGGTDGRVSLSQDLANGWITWVDSPSPPGGALTLSSVAAPGGNAFTAFAGASNGNLYRLATGSGLWLSAGAPFGSNPSRLAYQNDQVLVCVTSAGLIFTTSNGGGSWTQSYAHTKDLPRNVWMSSSILGLGYVVCSNGTILRTVTGGQ